MQKYLTIKECINENVIALSERQIKRRVQQVLNKLDDNRAIYQLRKGIKTIVLMVEYATTICRNRKPKTKKNNTNEVEKSYINNLLKTEITINFKDEFNDEGINNIVRFYESSFPAVYVSEGENRNKKHLHLAVSENIEHAKLLICKSLATNGINLESTDIKISQIASTSKILEYLQKGSFYGAYLRFKNCNYFLPTIEYLQHCQNYITFNPTTASILSPYGKNYFSDQVFKHIVKFK